MKYRLPVKKYYKPKAGEWVQPVQRGYRMACCDCGLVHNIDFRVAASPSGKRWKAQFRVFRNGQATRAMRRLHGIKVTL